MNEVFEYTTSPCMPKGLAPCLIVYTKQPKFSRVADVQALFCMAAHRLIVWDGWLAPGLWSWGKWNEDTG